MLQLSFTEWQYFYTIRQKDFFKMTILYDGEIYFHLELLVLSAPK